MTCRLFAKGHDRRGFSLMETAIVMGLAGFVVTAIWVAGARAWENYRIYRVTQQITTVISNVRDAFVSTRNWTPLGAAWTNADITKLLDDPNRNLLPVDMRRHAGSPGATEIDHALNGSVVGGSFRVSTPVNPLAATLGGGGYTSFRVALMGLSRSACIKLLAHMPLNDPQIGIVRINVTPSGAVGMINGYANGQPQWSVSVPILPDVATVWCAGTANDNEIDIDFRLHN